MVKTTATIRNRAGIHVRPSGVLVEAAQAYEGSISLHAKGMETDLNNVIGLLAMGLVCGDTVEISIDGPNEEEMCNRLKNLIETEFDFPPRTNE